MKELIIDAKQENLDAVLDFINSELESNDCPLKLQTQIDISVEEIFANIANYSYNPEIGIAIIRIAVSNEIVIEFEDNGIPFNPLLMNDPNIKASIDERDLGGLGIYMVKNFMDEVEYRYEDNKNLLVIKKAIA